MEFLPPSFLISSPQNETEYYQKVVILLLEHDRHGATGLIVNKPSDLPLHNFVQIEGMEIPSSVLVWSGGICEQSKGIILHNQPSASEYDNPGDIFGLSANSDILQRMVSVDKHNERLAIKHPYRFLIGCSCWQPQQLDKEMRQGDWIQLSLDQHILFNVHPEEMWQHSLAVLGITPASIIPQRQVYSH